MGKTIERMRANPRADWQIGDVERACREAGVAYQAVRRAALQGRQRRSRTPVYDLRATAHKAGLFVKLVQFLDEEGAR